MSSFINRLRASRFRQAAENNSGYNTASSSNSNGASGDLDGDVLLPPPLPLIKLPDEPQQARTGALDGRPLHLPVRRHLHPEQRNQPPEPNLQENRMLIAAQAEQDNATLVQRRVHVYEYNQPEIYQFCGAPDDTLVFDSLFEGGNLQRAERLFRESSSSSLAFHHEYELTIHPDIKNSAYRQWFYFEVRNAQPHTIVKFSLVNLAKSGALFGAGLQPCVYSEIDAETRQRGWCHAGTHVRYDVSPTTSSTTATTTVTNTLSFQYEFQHANDRVFFACLQPYSYTDLMEYLAKLEADPQRSVFLRRSELCQTIAGNACDLLTITSHSKESIPHDDKKLIVLSARVHPGEPNASWMMKGMLDYLTGPSSGAAVLRSYFVFKIVPMLNPDGVINGNTRVNLAGWDLNRKWSAPVEKLFPTVFHLKKLLLNWQSRDPTRVAIYCDLHGHSISRNIFTYGCFSSSSRRGNKKLHAAVVAATASATSCTPAKYDSGSVPVQPAPAPLVKTDPRVFPMIVAKNCDLFSFQSCDFKVHKSKLNTARVVVNQELGVVHSYTLEASFCGPDFGARKDTQFSIWDLEDMGRAWCQSLLIYYGLLPHVRAMDGHYGHQSEQLPSSTAAKLNKEENTKEEEEHEHLTILTPDAALLEMNADILSDCEAAISELFAAVDQLEEPLEDGEGDGQTVTAVLSDSGDSDLSGAEDAIPPNNEPAADARDAVDSRRISRGGRQSPPQYVMLSAGKVSGYASAPEEYTHGGSAKTITKKLKRSASSTRRKKKSVSGGGGGGGVASGAEGARAEGSTGGRRKSKKKKKKKTKNEQQAEDACNVEEDAEDDEEQNGAEEQTSTTAPTADDLEEEVEEEEEEEEDGRQGVGGEKERGGEEEGEDVSTQPVKRKSSKHARRRHRSRKDRSRSSLRKSSQQSKSSSATVLHSSTSVPSAESSGRTDSGRVPGGGLVLPDVPGSSGSRRHKTPPMTNTPAAEPSSGGGGGVPSSATTAPRKRSSKLVRIGSGQPLELPPVRASSSQPRELKPSKQPSVPDQNHSGSSAEEDAGKGGAERRGEGHRNSPSSSRSSSCSSSDSDPDPLASEFF